MPNRTAKFVSAIVASLLAGGQFTTASGNAVGAADSCLSAPNATAPEGSHWFYRVDRPTKRHCWYLRDGRESRSQGAAQDLSPAANVVAPPKKPAPPPAVANARAELPLPQPRVAPATNAASADQRTTDASTQRPIPASRWPDPSDVSSTAGTISAGGVPAARDPVANLQSNPVATPPPPVKAAVMLAAAEPSSANQSISIPKLLLVIAGALSVVSVMGNSIFRFGGPRPTDRREARTHWHANLDSVAIDRRPPPIYPNAGRRTRDTRAADDPSRRIAEMLSRLSQDVRT